MKISKRTREEAINVLILDAYNDVEVIPSTCRDGRGIDRLEYKALVAVWRATDYTLDDDDDCLEAAALLRDGWCPGEPVVRR